MRKYVKPSIDVIELQLAENIAAVPTTVYKGNASGNVDVDAYNLALSELATGLKKDGEFVIS